MVLVTERLERGPISVGVGGFPEVFGMAGWTEGGSEPWV